MIEKWKVVKRDVYKHSAFRAIEDVTYQMPGGEERVFSLKKEGSVVAILALDSHQNVILTRQYRPGPDAILNELPGGGIHKNESPLEAARREFLEETGYQSENWIELGRPLECAYSTITRYAFLAQDCKRTSDPNPDETEFIEVVKKSIPQFLDQLQQGQCTDLEVGWMGLYHLGFIHADT